MGNYFNDRMTQLFGQEAIENPVQWVHELYKNRILDVLDHAQRFGSRFGDIWGHSQRAFEDAVIGKLKALSLDASIRDVSVIIEDLDRRVNDARFAFGTRKVVKTDESEPVLRRIIEDIDMILFPIEGATPGRNQHEARLNSLFENGVDNPVKWVREVYKARILDVLNRAHFYDIDFDELWRSGKSDFDNLVAKNIARDPDAIAEIEKLEERIDDARSVEGDAPLGNGGHTSRAARTTQESDPILRRIINDIDIDLTNPGPARD